MAKPPKKTEYTPEHKAKMQKRGAEFTVRRRTTKKKVRAELEAGEHQDPLEDPPLMNAMDLIIEDPIHGNSSYKPEYARIAQEMCRLGATDIELARALGISLSTMWGWQSRHEEFFRACIIGEDYAMIRVERALYGRATGYTYPEVDIRVVDKQLVMTPILTHIPPDVGAASRLLKAWNREKWGDEAKLSISADETFKNIWEAISQGTTIPIVDNLAGDGDGSE